MIHILYNRVIVSHSNLQPIYVLSQGCETWSHFEQNYEEDIGPGLRNVK
jgi:hypothetical protein